MPLIETVAFCLGPTWSIVAVRVTALAALAESDLDHDVELLEVPAVGRGDDERQVGRRLDLIDLTARPQGHAVAARLGDRRVEAHPVQAAALRAGLQPLQHQPGPGRRDRVDARRWQDHRARSADVDAGVGQVVVQPRLVGVRVDHVRGEQALHARRQQLAAGDVLLGLIRLRQILLEALQAVHAVGERLDQRRVRGLRLLGRLDRGRIVQRLLHQVVRGLHLLDRGLGLERPRRTEDRVQGDARLAGLLERGLDLVQVLLVLGLGAAPAAAARKQHQHQDDDQDSGCQHRQPAELEVLQGLRALEPTASASTAILAASPSAPRPRRPRGSPRCTSRSGLTGRLGRRFGGRSRLLVAADRSGLVRTARLLPLIVEKVVPRHPPTLPLDADAAASRAGLQESRRRGQIQGAWPRPHTPRNPAR